MKKVRVVTDSASGLPRTVQDEYQISVVPIDVYKRQDFLLAAGVSGDVERLEKSSV